MVFDKSGNRHVHHTCNVITVRCSPIYPRQNQTPPGNDDASACRATQRSQTAVLHQHFSRDQDTDESDYKSSGEINSRRERSAENLSLSDHASECKTYSQAD